MPSTSPPPSQVSPPHTQALDSPVLTSSEWPGASPSPDSVGPVLANPEQSETSPGVHGPVQPDAGPGSPPQTITVGEFSFDFRELWKLEAVSHTFDFLCFLVITSLFH